MRWPRAARRATTAAARGCRRTSRGAAGGRRAGRAAAPRARRRDRASTTSSAVPSSSRRTYRRLHHRALGRRRRATTSPPSSTIATWRITHVIRGDDHLTNTARQLLLFEALGAVPPRYAHHSLVLGPDGGKLSKRHGATAVGEYRELGYLPQAIVNYLALLSLVARRARGARSGPAGREFDLEGLSASPAVFDQPKLDWLDHEHMMALDAGGARAAVRRAAAAGTPPPAAAALAAAFKPSLVALRPGAQAGGAGARRRRSAAPACAGAGCGRRAAGTQLPRPARRRAGVARRPPARRELLAAYRAAGEQARHRRARPAHAAAYGAHRPRARSGAALRARRPRPRRRPGAYSTSTCSPGRCRRAHADDQETSRDPPLQLADPAERAVRAPRPGQGRHLLSAAPRSTTWCTSATPVPT